MKLSKSKRYSIFTLAAVFLIAVFTAVGLLATGLTAGAEREITLTGSSYFYTSNNAEIDAYTDADSDEYQSFVLNSDSDYVTYRKNLAYSWMSAAWTDKDSLTYSEATSGMFSMTVGFTSLSFDTFTIKFQSQQYTLTEDAVTSNYLTFVKGTDCVYVITTQDEPTDDEIAEAESKSHPYSYTQITISFTAYEKGIYYLEVTDGAYTSKAYDSTDASDETYVYSLENIGSTYAKYVSSSSSNSVIPLTFSAEGIDSDPAEIVLYSLNGQSFQLYDTEYDEEDGSYLSGEVHDSVAPVLCLDDQFSTVRYGYGLELNYAVIDVLATSPRTTINYYILTNDYADDTTLNLESCDTVEYVSVSTSDTYAFIDTYGAYTGFTDAANSGYTTKCLVKIYLEIKDSTASGGTTDYVFLDWYVDSGYLAEVNGYNFIRAVKDTVGASYGYVSVDEDTSETYNSTLYSLTLADIMDADNTGSYQYLVEKAAAEQEITAGDDNYFYLPSFEGYISDNLEGYQDLTYSIYYVAGTSSSVSSETSLDYNKLSIELSDEGTYRFVIFATDSESNDMFYWSYDKDNTEWVRVTFDASDITDMLSDANSTLWDYVPYFEFSVIYEGLVVEDPIAQDICYVDNEYTAASFDITGLNSGYKTSYTLYKFNREAYFDDGNGTISYSEIIEKITDADDNWFIKNSKYFSYIKALDDMEETDPDYDDYCDYEWDPDSLSFVPQDENTFYVIRLVVTDTNLLTDSVTTYMVISSSAAAEELTGESRWLQDNLASVILLAVAAAALIGIVLLIVIKPKETGDIDLIDMEEDKPARKKIKKNKTSEE